jgi:hypothetical protein
LYDRIKDSYTKGKADFGSLSSQRFPIIFDNLFKLMDEHGEKIVGVSITDYSLYQCHSHLSKLGISHAAIEASLEGPTDWGRTLRQMQAPPSPLEKLFQEQELKDEESLDQSIRNVTDQRGTSDDIATPHGESSKRNPANKARWGCSILILVTILAVVYSVTSSFSPLAAYNTNNTLAKVIVSILAGLFALLFLGTLRQNLVTCMMRKSVERGTGRSADEAICPSCGLSVFLNNDTLGLPIVCHTCHVAWHDGSECYRRGMPPSNAILPSYPCPNCRSSNNLMVDVK